MQYKETDPILVEKYEHIKYTIIEETKKYSASLERAKQYIEKKYKSSIELDKSITGKDDKTRKIGDELMGVKEISADDAFYLYASHGLSPTQIKSLGYTF